MGHGMPTRQAQYSNQEEDEGPGTATATGQWRPPRLRIAEETEQVTQLRQEKTAQFPGGRNPRSSAVLHQHQQYVAADGKISPARMKRGTGRPVGAVSDRTTGQRGEQQRLVAKMSL